MWRNTSRALFLPVTSFAKTMSTSFHQPVEVHYTGSGIQSTGIDWADYGRMTTHRKKLESGRKLPTPEWVNNNTIVREVLVLFMEERAHLVLCGKKGTMYENTLRGAREGTLNDRLDRAHKTMLERQRPKIEANLQRLCARWATEAAEKKARLTILIENADTQLRIIERGAAVFLGVLHYTYRMGMDSVAVAAELGLKPPHVRQILYRLKQAHEMIEGIRAGRVHVVPYVPHIIQEKLSPRGERVKLCTECGGEIHGRGNRANTCGKSCLKKRALKRKQEGRRCMNARPAEHLSFCSPKCKETFHEHPLETLKRLGIDLDAVRKEDGESYAQYVLYCARLNQAPMAAAQWEMLTHGARWYGK
jgi:hypothetical protein